MISAILFIIPVSSLPLLQLLTLPISLFSKLPQIASNARAHSTGNLSAIAVFAQILGCAARLFTTSAELGGDKYVLWGFGLALILNGIIGAQMLRYWGQDPFEPSTVADKKAEQALPATASSREKDLLTTPVEARGSLTTGHPVLRGNSPSPNFAGSRKWTRKID
jgi:mannose-P-dolichol utilization defect protein 1